MKRGIIVGAWFVLLAVGPARAQADVVSIQASSCKSGDSRMSSGFILKKDPLGQAGPVIVTALHGTVGCRSLKAWFGSTDTWDDLVPSGVDTTRDLVYFSSAKLAHSNRGYEAAFAAPGLSLVAIGYPLGVSSTRQLKVSSYEIGALRGWIPPKELTVVEARNSPKLETKVLRMAAQLTAGDSGGPIIANGRVVAVILGGLANGYIGMTWAVPLSEAQWKAYSRTDSEISRLGLLDPRDARLPFSVADAGRPAIDEKREKCLSETDTQACYSVAMQQQGRCVAAPNSELLMCQQQVQQWRNVSTAAAQYNDLCKQTPNTMGCQIAQSQLLEAIGRTRNQGGAGIQTF